jgi:DNA polymerase III subunit gamma/tau
MADYQVLARKYRPQRFLDVIGQDPIITTLKNAIKNKRLAHAYLFCGSRGTGKTTLARIFAKALNCLNPNDEGEPCNSCLSCKEITGGHSLDVLEIDGASHRGIDDVRQINETVGYAASNGGYKIYIIDEVHMLTKEAFNALLKTLEEPPPKVMFLFATTEPHKVLPTILSRCQRFNLSRIPVEKIIAKLKEICHDLNVNIQEEAVRLIACHAEGGLRDAESLLDQIISFHEGEISVETVSSIFGLMPQEVFFALDAAGKAGNLALAFEIAHQVFSQGKDFMHFIENLTEHFRILLMTKMSGKASTFLNLTQEERSNYESSAKLYSQEQLLNILDHLLESTQQIRFTASTRIALEAILLWILRSHRRLPIEYLVKRLIELEKIVETTAPTPTPPPSPAPAFKSLDAKSQDPSTLNSLSVDPTPSSADLGLKETHTNKLSPKAGESKLPPSTHKEDAKQNISEPSVKKVENNEPSSESMLKPSSQKQSRVDTLLQFAAVELEGTIHRKL